VRQGLAFAQVLLDELNVQLKNNICEGKSPPDLTEAMGKH